MNSNYYSFLTEKDYEGIVAGGLLGDGKLWLLDERHYGWTAVDDGSNDVDGMYERDLGGSPVDAAFGKRGSSLHYW